MINLTKLSSGFYDLEVYGRNGVVALSLSMILSCKYEHQQSHKLCQQIGRIVSDPQYCYTAIECGVACKLEPEYAQET